MTASPRSSERWRARGATLSQSNLLSHCHETLLTRVFHSIDSLASPSRTAARPARRAGPKEEIDDPSGHATPVRPPRDRCRARLRVRRRRPASSRPPRAQAPKHTLKFNHVLGPKEPYHAGFQNWAKRVDERTNGGLNIEVFHSAQLGKEEDIIEQIRQGANIGQNTDSARMGNYVPGIAVMNGPYFVETLEEVAKLRKAPDGPASGSRSSRPSTASKCVCFNWVQGYRHFFTNKPVAHARGPQGPAHPHASRADLAGVDPRARRGAGRDGVRRDVSRRCSRRRSTASSSSTTTFPGGRFYEVLKFANETKHIMLINFEVVSAKWFDSAAGELPDRSWSRSASARARRRRGDLPARGRGRAAAQGAAA